MYSQDLVSVRMCTVHCTVYVIHRLVSVRRVGSGTLYINQLRHVIQVCVVITRVAVAKTEIDTYTTMQHMWEWWRYRSRGMEG